MNSNLHREVNRLLLELFLVTAYSRFEGREELPDWLVGIDYYVVINEILVLSESKEITYGQDLLNPDSYLGWEFVWSNIRQLIEMHKGNESLYFTYNEYGIRISKTYVNGDTTVVTKYYLDALE